MIGKKQRIDPADYGPQLVLASGSPRRLELLSLIGLRPEVRPADIDETPRAGEHPADYVMRLAGAKSTVVVRSNEVAIGADTTVAIESEGSWTILGKPASLAEATEMLTLLSGREHKVFTGHVVAGFGRSSLHTAGALGVSTVTFRPLSTQDISEYISTGEPYDRAGAYAIQGGAAGFVESLDGSKSNVVGLDVELAQLLLDVVTPIVGDHATSRST